MKKRCQICGEGPTIAFASGFTSEYCHKHSLKALGDALERKARLVSVIKSKEKEVDRLRDDLRYFKNRYYDLREEKEKRKLEIARKRMKDSHTELSDAELEHINNALYGKH